MKLMIIKLAYLSTSKAQIIFAFFQLCEYKSELNFALLKMHLPSGVYYPSYTPRSGPGGSFPCPVLIGIDWICTALTTLWAPGDEFSIQGPITTGFHCQSYSIIIMSSRDRCLSFFLVDTNELSGPNVASGFLMLQTAEIRFPKWTWLFQYITGFLFKTKILQDGILCSFVKLGNTSKR